MSPYDFARIAQKKPGKARKRKDKMARILISAEDIIKRYHLPYLRINYLTKKSIFKVVKKRGTRRLYNLEEIDKKINEKR